MQSASATLENIDSLILQAQQFYVRATENLAHVKLIRHGKVSEYAVTAGDATWELNLVQQRKKELIEKKKLVIQ